MITVKLQGGLANQMFQYAIGKAWATQTKEKLCLDLSFLGKKHKNTTYREYELNLFKLSPVSIKKKLSKLKKIKYILMNKFISEKKNKNPQIKKNSYLTGYWQNEKYFKNIQNILIKDFEPKELDKRNLELINQINNENSISIHIRRGDYITNKNANQIHGVCSIEYYEKAVKYIKDRVKDPKFYVFSDDINWCKSNLNIKATFINHNKGKNSYKDLILMNNCKHNIIANSSFSWWGAWLNQNNNKIVIAPKQWFKTEKIEIIPLEWIKI